MPAIAKTRLPRAYRRGGFLENAGSTLREILGHWLTGLVAKLGASWVTSHIKTRSQARELKNMLTAEQQKSMLRQRERDELASRVSKSERLEDSRTIAAKFADRLRATYPDAFEMRPGLYQGVLSRALGSLLSALPGEDIASRLSEIEIDVAQTADILLQPKKDKRRGGLARDMRKQPRQGLLGSKNRGGAIRAVLRP